MYVYIPVVRPIRVSPLVDMWYGSGYVRGGREGLNLGSRSSVRVMDDRVAVALVRTPINLGRCLSRGDSSANDLKCTSVLSKEWNDTLSSQFVI